MASDFSFEPLRRVSLPFFVADTNGTIVFWNEAISRLFNIDTTYALGKTIWETTPLPLSERIKLDWSAHLDRTSGWSEEYEILSSNSSPVSIEFRVDKIKINAVNLFFCTCLPLKLSSKLFEEELAKLQAQKTQAILTLAGGIAHDFNNVLAAILSHLDIVLNDQALPESLRQFIINAQTSARRGAELVSKLTAFSRRLEPVLVDTDIKGLIEEISLSLKDNLPDNIQMSVYIDSSFPLIIPADRSQLMKAILSICLNAKDAMPDGGNLEISAKKTVIPTDGPGNRKAGDYIKIQIKDSGIGISKEILPHIFEPYFTTKTFGKGAGLGLSIAYNIINAHSGWIDVDSEVNKGCCFSIFLPYQPQIKNETSVTELQKLENDDSIFEGDETILVADDEELVRMIVRAVLTFRGYTVIEATSGSEAINLFNENKDKVALVILDIHMPKINGWETLESIRNERPDIPAILLSGGPTDGTQETQCKDNKTVFLFKPFENIDLLRTVRRSLDFARAMKNNHES
jgi:signal transduction histidine kinase/ActR/RegA family two-component response regulator